LYAFWDTAALAASVLGPVDFSQGRLRREHGLCALQDRQV
jgi:hypothetical protein